MQMSTKREISFVKMQGCGNDYIYIDCMENEITLSAQEIARLSDRHFGIGGDGVVLICASDVADAKMRMFNEDGSEGMMCGNAVRCIAKYLCDCRGMAKTCITIETRSGIKRIYPVIADGKMLSASVDMGQAILDPAQIPVELPGESVIAREVTIGGDSSVITCVSMGNPHCVIFCADPDALHLPEIGPKYEHDPIFPQRANIEFVRVEDDHTLNMRVWERGSGETLACGTGACAAAVAAVLSGYCAYDTDITVRLRGGELVIRYTKEQVTMTGAAELVFRGTISIS